MNQTFLAELLGTESHSLILHSVLGTEIRVIELGDGVLQYVQEEIHLRRLKNFRTIKHKSNRNMTTTFSCMSVQYISKARNISTAHYITYSILGNKVADKQLAFRKFGYRLNCQIKNRHPTSASNGLRVKRPP